VDTDLFRLGVRGKLRGVEDHRAAHCRECTTPQREHTLKDSVHSCKIKLDTVHPYYKVLGMPRDCKD
jgi:hypothetical protein